MLNNNDFDATSRLRKEFDEEREAARKEEATIRNKLPNDLAIMHIGGIAATVTIAAASVSTAAHEKAAAAASSFGVGLLCIVLCMIYQWLIAGARVLSMSSAIYKLDRGLGTPEAIKRKSKEGVWLVVLNTAIMLTSAGLFIYGAAQFVDSIRATAGWPFSQAQSTGKEAESTHPPGPLPQAAAAIPGSVPLAKQSSSPSQ